MIVSCALEERGVVRDHHLGAGSLEFIPGQEIVDDHDAGRQFNKFR